MRTVTVVIDHGDEGTHWEHFRRYRITACAHRFRAEGVCDTCGDDETETETETAK